MGFSEYPSAYDAVLWMNADFYTRILSQLGNGIIIKNGDDSVAISSTDLMKAQAKMFDMQSCLLFWKGFILSRKYETGCIRLDWNDFFYKKCNDKTSLFCLS